MKVSVGICTYNGEKFIAEQLNSILAQTRKPDEIIVSDAFSADHTVEIAREILNNCGIAYRILTYDEPQGILKNFSKCFAACTGDVVFSCDQDDVWMPNKIERFLPYFERGCVFVYSNAHVVDVNRNRIEDNFWACYNIDFTKLTPREFSHTLLRKMCIAGYNMAFSKVFFDQVAPIPYHFLHDSWLAICAPWFGEIAFIDEPLAEYRRHGNNVSDFFSGSKVTENTSEECLAASKHTPGCLGPWYYELLPDSWFGDQHHYIANQIFYDRMKAYVSAEYAEETQRSITFFGALLKCLPKRRFRSIGILLAQYLKGNYKLFRGNEKQLLRDIVYLLVNKNTDFVHDTDKW